MIRAGKSVDYSHKIMFKNIFIDLKPVILFGKTRIIEVETGR